MTSYTDAYEEQPAQSDEGTMSFLEHLDELRSRLIRVAIFVLIAFVTCWIFSNRIYDFLQVPVRAAMLEAQREAAIRLDNIPASALDEYLDKDRPVAFNFPTEIRVGNAIVKAGTTVAVKVQTGADGQVQLVTAAPVLINTETIVPEGHPIPRELYAPSNVNLSPDNRLVVPTVQGAFNLYIKVSFYAAIFFAVPFMLVQAWGFISPGLYPHEKKYAAPVILMASLFFLAGCAFAYYIAFPRAANFLLGVAAQGNLRPLVTADEYFDLIMLIMLGLGVIFEIPTLTFITARLGLVTPRLMLKVWRYAIMVIFIIAALISPTTDVPNLLVFAAPMMLLYFFSVFVAWLFHRRRQTEEEYQAMERKND